MINRSTKSNPIPIGKFQITLGGQKISYTLKRSMRARRIWLKIQRETGLTVTVPRNYHLSYLNQYLESESVWILRNLQKHCRETSPFPEAAPLPFNTISYLGENFKVTCEQGQNGLNTVRLRQNQLIIDINSSSSSLSRQELIGWLKDQAHKLIGFKVKEFAAQMGLSYNRVILRDQKSLWGSCSLRKNLNFSWRLIMAPEPVLDYVVVHELCHLKEMSHSKKFWNLVARYCPQWPEYRRWLNRHSLELHANPGLT